MNEPKCVAQRGRYTDSGKRNVKGNGPIEQYYEARVDGKTNALTTVQKDNNVAEPVRVGTMPKPNGEILESQGYRIYDSNGKSCTICAGQTRAEARVGLYAQPVRVGALPRPDGTLSTSQAFRIYDVGGKSVNITAGGGGAGGKTGLYAVPSDKPVYEVKDGQITIKGKQYPIKLADGHYIIRKLTVSECKRLQTVPEWYEFPVSDSQAYKMLGNGWTVDVIQHLIKHTLSGKVIKPKTEEYEQLEWSDYEKR